MNDDDDEQQLVGRRGRGAWSHPLRCGCGLPIPDDLPPAVLPPPEEQDPSTQHLRELGARPEVCDAHEAVLRAETDEEAVARFRDFLRVVGPVPIDRIGND